MGREIRRVPANWKHPNHYWSNLHGMVRKYRPMHQAEYKKAFADWEKDLKEWQEAYDLWQNGDYKEFDGNIQTVEEVRKEVLAYIEKERKDSGFDSSYKSDEYDVWKFEKDIKYSDHAGDPPGPPNPDDYMPFGKWYQLYETVSEGTPISPPFKTKKQLIEWLSNNKDFWGHTWTPEQASAMVDTEWAPSMIVDNGRVYTAEESVLLERTQDEQQTSQQ